MPTFDAVVLAGGAARRLGGVDKPAVAVAGVPLLHRVLAACRAAGTVVVVGPRRDLPPAVVQVREDPPGGGPVAALRAGLPQVRAQWVAVLAADLPFLTGAALHELLAAAAGHDGALLVDDQGRDQVLCGVWDRARLAAALAAVDSPRIRDVLAGLDPVRRGTTVQPAPWLDCDTDMELERADRAAADLAAADDTGGGRPHGRPGAVHDAGAAAGGGR